MFLVVSSPMATGSERKWTAATLRPRNELWPQASSWWTLSHKTLRRNATMSSQSLGPNSLGPVLLISLVQIPLPLIHPSLRCPSTMIIGCQIWTPNSKNILSAFPQFLCSLSNDQSGVKSAAWWPSAENSWDWSSRRMMDVSFHFICCHHTYLHLLGHHFICCHHSYTDERGVNWSWSHDEGGTAALANYCNLKTTSRTGELIQDKDSSIPVINNT